MVTIEQMKDALTNSDRQAKVYEDLCSQIGIFNFGRKAKWDSDSRRRFMESTSIAELQRWNRMEYDADAFFDRLCNSDCFDISGRVK